MSYNTPVRTLQGGSVLEVVAGGTISVNGGVLLLGGTAGRWAFGTAALTSGTALVYTGLTTVVSANAAAITVGNNGTGAGTATSFQMDYSRAANGTVYFFGVTGTAAFTGAGTFAWQAFGN
jgi:hypothetical protein